MGPRGPASWIPFGFLFDSIRDTLDVETSGRRGQGTYSWFQPTYLQEDNRDDDIEWTEGLVRGEEFMEYKFKIKKVPCTLVGVMKHGFV